jgi:hypothetical protein
MTVVREMFGRETTNAKRLTRNTARPRFAFSVQRFAFIIKNPLAKTEIIE